MNKLYTSFFIVFLSFSLNAFAETDKTPLSTDQLEAAKESSCSDQINVAVNGLVCDFCARALEKVFGKREDVTSIEVDLNIGKVVINTVKGADIDDATLTQLITDSGYDLVAIDKGCS